jgi:hypothetical protein
LPQESHVIPDCTTQFILGTKPFALDLVDAVDQINQIAKRCEGQDGFEHLDEFKKWIKSVASVELTRGQADYLWDFIQGEYVRAKKQRRPDVDSSPSTAVVSTPSE